MAWAWSWPTPQLLAGGLGFLIALVGWIDVVKSARSVGRFDTSVAVYFATSVIVVVLLVALLPLRIRVAADSGALKTLNESALHANGSRVEGSCFTLVTESGGSTWVVGVGQVSAPQTIQPTSAGSFPIGTRIETFDCGGSSGTRFSVPPGTFDNPFDRGGSGLIYAPSGLPPVDDPMSLGSSYTYLYDGWYRWDF